MIPTQNLCRPAQVDHGHVAGGGAWREDRAIAEQGMKDAGEAAGERDDSHVL